MVDVETLVGRELVAFPSTYHIFRDTLMELKSLGGLTELIPLVDAFEKAFLENNLSRFWLWLSPDEKIRWMNERKFATGDGYIWNNLLVHLRERVKALKLKDIGALLVELRSDSPVDHELLRRAFLTISNELTAFIPQAKDIQHLYPEVQKTLSTEGFVSGDLGTILGEQINPLIGKVPIVSKEITVISGRTGRGKTNISLNIIYWYLLHGRNVVLISTEMPEESIICRLCSIHTGTPTQTYLFERDISAFERDVQSLISALTGRFAILHAPLISYADIDVTARTKAEEWGKIDLLVIDYIQQVVGFTELESRALQLRRIVQSLHHLSSEVGTATIVLSQLNDKGDVKDSRSIEEEAALCTRLGMWTMDKFVARMWRAAGLSEDTPLTPEIREIFKEIFQTHIDFEVKKNRYGENLSGWTFFVVWNGDTGKVHNVVEWTSVARTISEQFKHLRKGKRKKEEPQISPQDFVDAFENDLPDDREEEDEPF